MLPMGCIPPGTEHGRNTKAGLFLGGTEMGDSSDGNLSSRTPWWPLQTHLESHCSLRLLHQPSFPPSLLPLGSDLHCGLTVLQLPPFSAPYFVTDMAPIKYLARIIPSQCLFLRGPGLTHLMLDLTREFYHLKGGARRKGMKIDCILMLYLHTSFHSVLPVRQIM